MPSRGGRRGRAAQQPGGPLQAIAAALTRFTVLMRSADGRQSQQDRDRAIAQLGDALAAIAGGPRCSKFGQSEQAVLRAVLAALRELAALRLERTAGWLHDLAVVLSAWGYALYVLTGDQEFIQESQDWMKQLGAEYLMSAQKLMLGVLTVARREEAVDLQGTAAYCAHVLLTMLSVTAAGQPPAARLPALTAGMDLASLLIHGPAARSVPGNCSCCLSSDPGSSDPSSSGPVPVPVLALSRAAQPLHVCHMGNNDLATAEIICGILEPLSWLQMDLHTLQPAGHRLAGSKPALLLAAQWLALCLAHARRLQAARRRPATTTTSSSSASSSGSSATSCADLTAFLGAAEAAAALAPLAGDEQKEHDNLLLTRATSLLTLLAGVAERGGPICPLCTPQQLLLAVEALTLHRPRRALRAATLRNCVLVTLSQVVTKQQAAWGSWVPDFMRRASPALAAFVVAAADELPAGPVPGSGTDSAIADRSSAAAVVLNTLSVILAQQGGLLLSPPPGDQLQLLQQLVAAAERALRALPADHIPGFHMSMVMLTALIAYPPACFDQLWRTGALAGLVVTACKRLESSWEVCLHLHAVLQALLPAAGRDPWWSASTERQQFALLTFARIGSKLARALLRIVQGQHRPSVQPPGQQMADIYADVEEAAELLGQDALLGQHLDLGAPGWRRDAQLLSERPADERGYRMQDASLTIPDVRPLELLIILPYKLDQLAPGLALPGCYNPACTSLAGASEAGMPLKWCAGCQTARYCGPDCAKAHWKQHKEGCKRETAARQARAAAAGGGRQQD